MADVTAQLEQKFCFLDDSGITSQNVLHVCIDHLAEQKDFEGLKQDFNI